MTVVMESHVIAPIGDKLITNDQYDVELESIFNH